METIFRNKFKNPIHMTGTILLALFAGSVLTLMVYFALESWVKLSNPLSTILAGLIGVSWLFFNINKALKRPNIIVNEHEVIFKRKDTIVRRFKFSECAMSSYVLRTYANGIPTGTHRYLVVNDGEKEKQYKTYLRKKDFDQMMALVIRFNDPTSSTKVSGEEPKQEPIFGESTLIERFKINKQLLDTPYYFKRFLPIFVVFGLGFIVTLVMKKQLGDILFYTIFFYCLFLLAIILIVLAILKNSINRRMPNSIEVYSDKLIVGDQVFRNHNIAQIKMAPASRSYVKGPKSDLTITTTDRRSFSYKLTYQAYNQKGKEDQIFPQYAQCAEVLRKNYIDNFIFDL